jgi:(2Fe-2S) ferredoxin
MVSPKHHVFICTSCRINGVQKGFCFQKGSVDLTERLMAEIEERDLSADCMVTNTGCFGVCAKGPVMVVYPEGVWYGNLDEDAIGEIAQKHLEDGEVVEAYRI